MFASANNKPAGNQQPGDPPAWLMEGNDPLDVDLLAEYLLEDGTPAPGMTFDFNMGMDNGGNGNNSSVVSPEQSEDGGFPPVAENSAQQHLLAPPYQPPAPGPPQQHHQPHQQHHLAPPPPSHMTAMAAPPAFGVPVGHSGGQLTYAPAPVAYTPGPAPVNYAPAPVAYAPVPAPLTYAPAPAQPVQVQALAPAPPMHGGHGIPTMAMAPAYQAPPTHAASNLVVHQHGNFPKRQRIDNAPPTAPGVATVPSAAPMSIVAGGQQLVAAAQAAALQGGRGRKKSQAQIDRRRERNRILARRTRLRKKFFFESLQKEVMDLQRQNGALKDLVKTRFSFDESRKVLETCKASEKLPEAVVEACGELTAEMDQQDFNLVRSVQQSQHSFIITDPCLADNPIVFASDGFLKVTGYAREDVLGRNCRFLQGPETSKTKLETVRRGLSVAEDTTVTMVNYMADGTPFWNKLFIAALRDSSNNIVNFIGVVVKVASPPEGDPEFGKVLATDEEAESTAADGAVHAVADGLSAAVAAAPAPML